MASKTKIEVTIEKHQRITVRGLRYRVEWCERCAARVLMITPSQAAALTRSTAREIFRRVNAGELHSLGVDEDDVLVCRNSLEDDVEKSKPGKPYRRGKGHMPSDA